MISEIKDKDGKMENRTSVIIDCSKGKMTVENRNNGSEPEVSVFEIGGSVTIETINTDQAFQLIIGKPDNGSDVNSMDVNEEPEPEITGDNDQTVGTDIKTEPDFAQTVSLLEEITAEEIAGEIQGIKVLGRNEIKTLCILVRKGDMTRKEILETIGIHSSSIVSVLRELEDLGLICSENRKPIKPNLEKIRNSYPWLYSKEVQEAILNIGPKANSKFSYGKSTQYTLYLLCKHPNGLDQNEIIDSMDLSIPGFYITKKMMIEKDIIKVEKEGKLVIIFPNFSVNQIGENPVISEEPTVVKTDPAQETAEAEESVAVDNKNKGFNKARLLSLISRIDDGSSISLHKISSELGAKKYSERLTNLLDIINNKVANKIEIVEDGTDTVMTSWEPKDFDSFDFNKLVVREKRNNPKKEDVEIEDTEKAEQAIDSASDDDLNNISNESENKEVIIGEEQKREDAIKKINAMIATPYLGGPHKIVMSILFDNYVENNSLEMEVSGLTENAKNKGLREAEIRECFKGLQSLRFVEKPGKTIKLKIKT